jgi:hypothetical protein
MNRKIAEHDRLTPCRNKINKINNNCRIQRKGVLTDEKSRPHMA